VLARTTAAATAALVIGSLVASPASASTIVGSTFPPANTCAGGVTVVETGPPAGKSYAVPSAGVITSWTFQAGPTPPQLEFKAFRSAGGSSYTVLGSTPALALAPNALDTVPARIPVAAGDILGETVLTTGGCAVIGGTVAYFFGDPPVGSTATYNPSGSGTYDLSAIVEPDADGDGYGDETQDSCPTRPGPTCDLTVPTAKLTGGPIRTHKHSARFTFTADEPATFECRLKGPGIHTVQVKQFEPCSSPKKYRRLKTGKFTFYVRATDTAGNVSRPLKHKFRVLG